MFDLEQSIADWRRRMLAAGIKTPVPLEELEGHLREDVEQQIRSGLNKQEAYDAAVQRIGQAVKLKVEFEKLGRANEVSHWRLVGITYSIFAVWISMLVIYSWLTVPKLSAAFSLTDRILVFTAMAASLLSTLGWRCCCQLLPVIHNRRARTGIGVAGCLFGVTGMLFFWRFIMPLYYHRPAQEFTILTTWAWTVMAILGGVGYGLAGAAFQPGESGSATHSSTVK